MRRAFGLASLVMLCVAGLSQPARAQEEQIGIALGSSAPASIPVETLDGQAVDLGSYLGRKPVVIEFWATWCPLCKALLPQLKAAHERHGEKVDILVVAVAVNESPRTVKRHLAKDPMPFKFFWDGKGAAVRAFEAPSTSYVVGLDARGQVAYTGLGDKQDIEAVVKKVL